MLRKQHVRSPGAARAATTFSASVCIVANDRNIRIAWDGRCDISGQAKPRRLERARSMPTLLPTLGLSRREVGVGRKSQCTQLLYMSVVTPRVREPTSTLSGSPNAVCFGHSDTTNSSSIFENSPMLTMLASTHDHATDCHETAPDPRHASCLS